jgi:hypothetical protein
LCTAHPQESDALRISVRYGLRGVAGGFRGCYTAPGNYRFVIDGYLNFFLASPPRSRSTCR